MRAPQLRVLLIICSRHLVLAIIVSLPALGAARTMPRTRRRAILLLFVSARSHLAEQGLHLCAERKFVRAAQRKGAGGPARSCRGLCLGKCPFWLCSDGARFWVCTAPHLSANLIGVRATSSRSSFKTTHTKTATRPRSLAIHQAPRHSTSNRPSLQVSIRWQVPKLYSTCSKLRLLAMSTCRGCSTLNRNSAGISSPSPCRCSTQPGQAKRSAFFFILRRPPLQTLPWSSTLKQNLFTIVACGFCSRQVRHDVLCVSVVARAARYMIIETDTCLWAV